MIKYRNDLGKYLVNKRLTGIGIEIGVARGINAKQILDTWSGYLYLVDPWQHIDKYEDIANVSDLEQETIFRDTVKLLTPYFRRVTILRRFSKDAVSEFPDEFFDFIYIDADHSYEAIKLDISIWWPKLKKGGLMGGHDYVDGDLPEGKFGVKSAVDEFLNGLNNPPQLTVTDEHWPSWFFHKNE